MRDTFGRNIDYLRISLTDRCNFRCVYCMPPEGVCPMSHDEILRIEEVVRLVRIAAKMGVKAVRLTGGEPLVRKGVVDAVAGIARIPGIEDISLTTNGSLLARYAQDLRDAGLKRVNISLDTLDPDQFHEITRLGNLEDTLCGIQTALDMGFNPVKLNVVVVRHLNQDLFRFAQMSISRPLHVRFIEFMPLGSLFEENEWSTGDVVPSGECLDTISEKAAANGLGPLRPAAGDAPQGRGPAQYYKFEGAYGSVGFISSLSNHFCATCNRLRLTADGKLRPCLFSDMEFDVRRALREGSDEDVARVLQTAVDNKPDAHHYRVSTERNMSQIGG